MHEGQQTLELLRRELRYLEDGGYQNAMGWHPQLLFQDSPTCPNYYAFGNPHPCTACALIEFVPEEHRARPGACRYIPLDDSGVTLDNLYRWASQAEIEGKVRNWLLRTLARLERETANGGAAHGHAELTFGAMPEGHAATRRPKA